jgi:hypothetical protein
MANYRCPNGHEWKAPGLLSPRFDPAVLQCPECPARAETFANRKSGRSAGTSTSPLERDLHKRFTELVTEWPCFFSDKVDGQPRRPGHECWGRLDPHHLVPVDHMVKQLGLGPEIVFDPIIGVPLCRRAHDAVEIRSDFVYWHELDPECIAFCRKHKLLSRLKIESPKRTKGTSRAQKTIREESHP